MLPSPTDQLDAMYATAREFARKNLPAFVAPAGTTEREISEQLYQLHRRTAQASADFLKRNKEELARVVAPPSPPRTAFSHGCESTTMGADPLRTALEPLVRYAKEVETQDNRDEAWLRRNFNKIRRMAESLPRNRAPKYGRAYARDSAILRESCTTECMSSGLPRCICK